MDSITNLNQYINAYHTLLKIKLVIKIIDVDTDIDTCVARWSDQNIAYFDTALDHCVYLEGIALNDFEELKISARSSFIDDRDAHRRYLAFCREALKTTEAVLLSASAFAIVDNELAFYDPSLEGLGFKYVEIN